MTESVPNLNLASATLELDRNGPSLRHVLDSRYVADGMVLEVQLAGGGWLPLRYEARWVENDGEGRAGLFPRWHLVVATRDGQAEVESPRPTARHFAALAGVMTTALVRRPAASLVAEASGEQLPVAATSLRRRPDRGSAGVGEPQAEERQPSQTGLCV